MYVILLLLRIHYITCVVVCARVCMCANGYINNRERELNYDSNNNNDGDDGDNVDVDD